MHISLDSALGRQRRLNSVGESITQIAPDPAAAYSLRSLTGGDPKVVRVRRASDNHEQDFTASDVSSGALQDFVNAQVVAPLDIREIADSNSDGNNDGRVGNYLIAKAAYSLRSLGTRQATLAATGDTVARANGKFVCQVRRDSDDALKSFTAAEVTDGTLVSWVGTSPATPQNITGFTLTNVSVQLIGSGGNATISGTFNGKTKWILDGESAKRIRYDGSRWEINDDGDDYFRSNITNVDYPWDSSLTWTEVEGSGTPTFGSFVGGLPTAGAGSGFVKTWYDQSVSDQAGAATGNHATQETPANQPRIVSAGNYLGALLFDGSDDFLLASFSNPFTSDSFTASVVNFKTTSGRETVFDYRASNPYVLECNSSARLNIETSSIFNDSSITITDNQDNLLVTSTDSSDTLIGVDGTTANKSGRAVSSGSASLNIGRNGFGGGINNLNGDIKEIIIYSSDQRSNRTAIEANIGEAYSITGIPAYDNTVDGFVETWYDQSGNGKDATQPTAGIQPKIVESGNLFADGLNFSPNRKINIPSDTLASTDYDLVNVFVVAKVNVTNGIQVGVALEHVNFLFVPALFNGSFQAWKGTAVGTSPANTNTNLFSLTAQPDGTYPNGNNAFLNSMFLNGSPAGTLRASTQSGNFNSAGIANYVNLVWNGSFQEIIVYNKNQTANRPAIEANIANQYDITLS